MCSGEMFQVVRQVLSGRGGHVDVVDFIDQHQVAAGVDEDLADGVGDVHLVVAALERQAGEGGEAGGELAGGALGPGGDGDDPDAVGARVTRPYSPFVG